MIRIFACFLCLVIGIISVDAHAKRSDSIASVVNEDVVTFTDLYDRIDMVMKSSGIPNNRKFREKLLPQVLTALITELVQLQEAKRLGHSVTQKDIDEGFERIAEQNKLTVKQFRDILRRQHVRMSSLERQIQAQIAWGKVIASEIRPRITVAQSEVDGEYNRLKKREGEEEIYLAEIYLPFNEKGDDGDDVQDLAKDLSKQLGKDIKKFPAAARQFSQSPTAANGGVIGWVTLDQLTVNTAESLKNLKVKKVSAPIKSNGGYSIFYIREKRRIDLKGDGAEAQESIKIRQAVYSLNDNDTDRKNQEKAANELARVVTGCLDIMNRVTKEKEAKLETFDSSKQAIPDDVLQAVEGLDIGESAKPITRDNTIIVPMVCGREGNDGSAARQQIEDEIENRMGMQRLNNLQKQYLRDLIAAAYIERRV